MEQFEYLRVFERDLLSECLSEVKHAKEKGETSDIGNEIEADVGQVENLAVSHKLNELGAEGWELVTVLRAPGGGFLGVTDTRYFFKRRRQ